MPWTDRKTNRAVAGSHIFSSRSLGRLVAVAGDACCIRQRWHFYDGVSRLLTQVCRSRLQVVRRAPTAGAHATVHRVSRSFLFFCESQVLDVRYGTVERFSLKNEQ